MSSEALAFVTKHMEGIDPYSKLTLIYLANHAGHDGAVQFKASTEAWSNLRVFVGLSDRELYSRLQTLTKMYPWIVDGRCGHDPDDERFSCTFAFPIEGQEE